MATFAQAFKIVGPAGLPQHLSTGVPQAINATSTVKNYALGTRVRAIDPVLGESEFIYLTGVANTAAGNFVQVNPDFTTTRAAGGTAKGFVGIAMSACVAANYGWYCIFGRCVATIAADVTANLAAYGAAAGVLADDVVATNQIAGAMLTAGLNAGGSAIPGTTDTTAAATTIALLQYPVAILAV
jgi:hypothetical protein